MLLVNLVKFTDIANATKSCQLTKQELNATRENGVVKANLWARTNFFSHFLSPVA